MNEEQQKKDVRPPNMFDAIHEKFSEVEKIKRVLLGLLKENKRKDEQIEVLQAVLAEVSERIIAIEEKVSSLETRLSEGASQ